MKSRGFAQIFAHYQSKEHLLRDQRYRYSCPGASVYDRKGRVLHGEALNKAKGKFLAITDVPELAPKRLLVGQREIPMASSDLPLNEIFAAQVVLFNRWLEEGGSLDLLVKNWTFFGTITHHEDTCANFDWSSPRVFSTLLGMFQFLLQTLVNSMQSTQQYSLLLSNNGPLTEVFLNLWVSDHLTRVSIGCYDRCSKQFPGALNAVSSVMSLHGQDTILVSLLGFPAKVVRAVDCEQGRTKSVMSVPFLNEDELFKLIRTPTTTILGRADLFSLVQYLVIRLQSAAGEHWVENSCHLRVVSILQ